MFEVPFERNPRFSNLTDGRLIEIVDQFKAEIYDFEKAAQKAKETLKPYYEELRNRAGLEQDAPATDPHICLDYMKQRGWRDDL